MGAARERSASRPPAISASASASEEGAALQFSQARRVLASRQQHRHRPPSPDSRWWPWHQLAQQRPRGHRRQPFAHLGDEACTRSLARAHREQRAAEASTNSVPRRGDTGQPAARRSSAMASGPRPKPIITSRLKSTEAGF